MDMYSMITSGMSSLLFFGDVTANRSNKMNYKVYRTILSGYIQLNAIKLVGGWFTAQMDNDTKHALKGTQNVLKVAAARVKWHVLNVRKTLH